LEKLEGLGLYGKEAEWLALLHSRGTRIWKVGHHSFGGRVSTPPEGEGSRTHSCPPRLWFSIFLTSPHVICHQHMPSCDN